MEGRYTMLNAKESRKIINGVKENYGIKEIALDYIFVRVNDKLFLASNDFKQLSTERIHNFGLFFARIVDGGLKLSIEGSQLVGSYATKNVAELEIENIKKWIAGYDVPVDCEDSFVIIKHNNDFFGCGKVKENLLMNSIPRERRIYNFSSGSRQDSLA